MSDLWPHQAVAVRQVVARFQVNDGAAAVEAQMGGGKTRVPLEALDRVGANRVVVVAPRAVAEDGWPGEVAAHGHRWPVTPLTRRPGVERAATLKRLATSRRWLVTLNYEALLIRPLFAELLAAGADALVIDEMHRTANPDGLRSYRRKPGSKSRSQSSQLAKVRRVCRFAVGLTGTPFSGGRGALPLWSYYQIFAPHLLDRSYTAFRDYITQRCDKTDDYDGARPVSRDGQLEYFKWRNLDWHAAAWSRLAWTVPVAPALDALPPPLDVYIDTALEPKARRTYRKLEREHAVALDHNPDVSIAAPNILARMTRLRQMTGGWFAADEPGVAGEVISRAKRDALANLLIDSWEPVVVFAQFHHDLDAIRLACGDAGRPYHEISGRPGGAGLGDWRHGARAWRTVANTPLRPRGVEPPVLAAQIQSGSEGISLVEASLGVFYSYDYSLLRFDQARGRLQRPGQTRQVRFYHLLAPGTIDVAIRQALDARMDFVQALRRRVVRWPVVEA